MHKWMGKQAQDTMTGFSGKITGYADYITGCAQFLMQPFVKEDGEFVEARWFDEQRIKILEGKKTTLENVENGACGTAPVK